VWCFDRGLGGGGGLGGCADLPLVTAEAGLLLVADQKEAHVAWVLGFGQGAIEQVGRVHGRGVIRVDEPVQMPVAGIHELVESGLDVRGQLEAGTLRAEDQDQARHRVTGLPDHVDIGEDAPVVVDVLGELLQRDGVVGRTLGIPSEDGSAGVSHLRPGGIGAGVARVVHVTLLVRVPLLDGLLTVDTSVDEPDAGFLELGSVAGVDAELEQEPNEWELGHDGLHVEYGLDCPGSAFAEGVLPIADIKRYHKTSLLSRYKRGKRIFIVYFVYSDSRNTRKLLFVGGSAPDLVEETVCLHSSRPML